MRVCVAHRKYGGGSDEPDSKRERVAVFSFASIAVSHEESGPRGRDLLIAEPSTEKECPRRLVRTDYRASDPKTPVRIRARALQGEISSMTPKASADSNAISQPVATPLTRAAIFLVVTVNPGAENRAVIRHLCKDLSSLVGSAGFRELDGSLSCVMAVGSDTWDRLFGQPRPAELRMFREILAGERRAPSTSGDILFHIRAKRMDLCFELATQIMARLGNAVSPVDEVHGFRYFDNRDLVGFVDGTENPREQAAIEATIIGGEDSAFAGGSSVSV